MGTRSQHSEADAAVVQGTIRHKNLAVASPGVGFVSRKVAILMGIMESRSMISEII